MGRIIDITGQRFGKLTVIKLVGTDKRGATKWLCKCDCGNEIIAYKTNLMKPNHTTSCGCYKREIGEKIKTTHNFSKTRIYKIWVGIKNRCYDSNSNVYYLYGKRGITVCKEWLNDFMAFYDWSMQNGYNEKLTIDRIDSNGNYEPKNCRWATAKEQSNNTSKNRVYFIDGVRYTTKQIAEKHNINYGTFISRIYRGWTIEEAINGKRNKP